MDKMTASRSHTAHENDANIDSKIQSANSRVMAQGTKLTKIKTGETYHMDGSALDPSFRLPKSIKTKLAIFVLLGALIGGAILYTYYSEVIHAPIREREAVEETLSKKTQVQLPILSNLVTLSDADIMTSLNSSGDTLFEKTPVGSGSSFEVIKLPEGVSLVDAGAMYLTGIDKLSPSQAVTLLNGSWDLNVNREKGMNMSLHYADFTSGSVENAVQYAIQAEGLDSTSITDSGVDSSGNVYSSGNITIGDITYAWKVSSVPLSMIYSISGVPESAAYVGVRFTS